MSQMNVLFVPCLSLDLSLLERLADSIDYPIQRKVAFNNGIPDALERFGDTHPDWIVVDSDTGNKGVADSWNECAKLFPEHPSWMICNEDCWFLPGQLEVVCKCSDDHPNEPLTYLNSSQAYYCFVWHSWGRKNIGEFDANFYPAYYEDCDYRARMRLMGITGHSYAIEGKPVVPHGKPKTGGVNYNAMIQGCGLLNRQYWYRKWGSLNFEKPTYISPYKDHRLTPSEWVYYVEERIQRRVLWDAFIGLPNPSIYD